MNRAMVGALFRPDGYDHPSVVI